MKKLMILVAVLVMMISNTFGLTLMNSLAEEQTDRKPVNYYTSVEIRPGDSLWSISCTYAHDTGLSTQEYMDLLRRMNHMIDDRIHAGSYLTVMYAGPAGAVSGKQLPESN